MNAPLTNDQWLAEEARIEAQAAAEAAAFDAWYATATPADLLAWAAGDVARLSRGCRGDLLRSRVTDLRELVWDGALSVDEVISAFKEAATINGLIAEDGEVCVLKKILASLVLVNRPLHRLAFEAMKAAGEWPPRTPPDAVAEEVAERRAALADDGDDGDSKNVIPFTLVYDDGTQKHYDSNGRLRPARVERTERADAAIWDPWDKAGVPDFPFEVFPDVLQRFVRSRSKAIGCDPSAFAMACMAILSAAIDHRFKLQITRTWERESRIWVLLVGGPSKKKTPAIREAKRPLAAHENNLRDQYERDLQDYLAAGGDPKKGGPPLPQRFIINDTTVEKLADILTRSDRGILVERDEVAGWIGPMERYGGSGKGASADRAFWLQAFDGGSFTVDRVVRGETRVRNLSVSLLGGIQPARLAELHGLTDDGLLQRFIPVIVGEPTFPADEPDDGAAAAYDRLVQSLIRAEPVTLHLSDVAGDAFTEIRRHLHDLEQVSSGVADGFQAFIGKLQGLAGSLALICHMAANPVDGRRQVVSVTTVENVRRIVLDFILPHAFEFYRSAGADTQGDRIQKLASWILTSGVRRIVSSDLGKNVAGFRGLAVDEINKRLSPLVASGWLTPELPGQFNRAWKVTERVFTQFAERAKAEEERKAKLAALLQRSHKGQSSD